MTAFLFSITLRALLVLALAYALAFALRRSSAAARHLIWTAAFVCLLALPVLSLLPEPWRQIPVPEPALFVSATPAVSAAPASPAAPPARFGWPDLIFLLWLAGVSVVWARLLAGVLRLGRLARIARRGTPPPYIDVFRELASRIGVRRPVTLAEGSPGAVPMAWGLWRAAILMPEDARHWPEERLRLALSHELVHVARRDSLTQRLAQVVCGIYWFLPLTWMAAGRLRKERELACDDRVLALGAKPCDYAQTLVDLARSQRPAAHSAAVSMAHPSELEGRVVALLDRNRNRRPVPRRGAMAVGLLTVFVSLALLPKAASPQNAGGLAGVVRDASGAAVPGAVVLLNAADSDQKEIATTGDSGEFGFRVLPEGTYDVRVTKPGFAALDRAGVVVRPNTLEQLELTLQVGGVSEVITVAAKAPAPASRTGPPRRIRVGGAVQATRLVYQVKPEYPESARQRGVEGTVLILAVISKDGSLLDAKAMNTLVDAELTQAALDAVRQWRYEPTLLNGEPVEVVTSVTVNFRLAQ